MSSHFEDEIMAIYQPHFMRLPQPPPQLSHRPPFQSLEPIMNLT